MADFQVAYNASTKVATIQAKGDALPDGSTQIGEFKHDDAADAYDSTETHVFYHHVRDALYTIGKLDMQTVRINQDTTYVALTAITITPDTVTLTVASPTQQLGITPTPSGASNPAIATWSGSDPTKATVSASGLVTRVANGTTTITATSVDGARTDTQLVTCTA